MRVVRIHTHHHHMHTPNEIKYAFNSNLMCVSASSLSYKNKKKIKRGNSSCLDTVCAKIKVIYVRKSLECMRVWCIETCGCSLFYGFV